jgi:hypothetical protein
MTTTARTALVPARFWIVAVLAIVVAHVLDPLAFRWLRLDDVYGEDWGRMLRVMGFVPLWIAGGAALML